MPFPYLMLLIVIIGGITGGALVYLLLRPKQINHDFYEEDWDFEEHSSDDLDSGDDQRVRPPHGLMGARLASKTSKSKETISPILSDFERDVAAMTLQRGSKIQNQQVHSSLSQHQVSASEKGMASQDKDDKLQARQVTISDSMVASNREATPQNDMANGYQPAKNTKHHPEDSAEIVPKETFGMDPWVKKLRAIHGSIEATDNPLLTHPTKFNEKTRDFLNTLHCHLHKLLANLIPRPQCWPNCIQAQIARAFTVKMIPNDAPYDVIHE